MVNIGIFDLQKSQDIKARHLLQIALISFQVIDGMGLTGTRCPHLFIEVILKGLGCFLR